MKQYQDIKLKFDDTINNKNRIQSSYKAIRNRYPSGILGVEQPTPDEYAMASTMYGNQNKILAKNRMIASNHAIVRLNSKLTKPNFDSFPFSQ